jgi:hypothetical protein
VQPLRLVLAVAGTVALAAVAAPGIGASGGSGKQPEQECGRTENVSGLEVVFGRFPTEAAANSFRGTVTARGFQNANVIQGCDGFRVVIRGMEDFDTAVGLQTEARKSKFAATIECIKGKEDVGDLEVVFGHRRTRADARELVGRAAQSGFNGLQLEPDPCGGFEARIRGFSSRSEAEDYVAQARRAGFADAVIEKRIV